MSKILILGGGFAGIYTAKALNKSKFRGLDIELISDNNYFIFQPLLPEVASGTINSSDAVTPIRQMLKNIKFRNAEVSGIDFQKKEVVIQQGFKKSTHRISYDQLVIALGQVSNLDIVPGLKDHAFKMRSLQDAHDLRNHIIGCLELADVTADNKLRNRLLNFVVVGGGFSGVETVGEIKEMIEPPFNSSIILDKFFFSLNLWFDISFDLILYFLNKFFDVRVSSQSIKLELLSISIAL